MEKISPKPGKETRKKMSDARFYGTAFTLVTLAAIDFAIHWNGGVSDPEIREFFTSNLGDWIKYVGNFGYAAAMSITAAGALKIASHADTVKGEADFTDHVVNGLGHIAPGCILALVLAVEGFAGNNHFLGDMTATVLGIELGKIVTNEALHRANAGRQHAIRDRVDKLFPMDGIPTSLPE